MRSIDLIKAAAEAEHLRLHAMFKRQARRAAFGLLAALFGLAVFVVLEALAWQVLSLFVRPLVATAILLGVNLLIAVALGFLAMRSSPSQVEREALAVRRRALESARGSLALTALIPTGRALLGLSRGNRRTDSGRRSLLSRSG
jgi:hypothetical protein